ncbi:MAG: pelota family protein [Nitrososphaerota archaeon]|nr:pelota family protein [Nitrososphaerota archaeon]
MNRLDVKHGLVTVTPEQPDDLWSLRRVIAKNDLVAGETSRVYKDLGEYSRPDKERIKVTVTIEVEDIQLDTTFSRLKVSGKIVDVSNELLSKGSFHSLTVSEGHRVSVKKSDGFSGVQLRLIEGANVPKDNFVIITLDSREAGIGIVRGTHLQILPTIESGVTGKMYQDSKKGGTGYHQKIADALGIVYPQGAKVFILGPGTTKDAFANYLIRERKEFTEIRSIDGSDVTGEDGVYVALRNPNLQAALSESRLAKVSKLIAESMRRISLNDPRVSLAFGDCLKAAKQGAVESLIIADKIFLQKGVEEDSIVDLLNSVEEYRGETFLLDSTTDLGSQVNTLGGAVGLLRFAAK